MLCTVHVHAICGKTEFQEYVMLKTYKTWAFCAFFCLRRWEVLVNTNGICTCNKVLRLSWKIGFRRQMSCNLQVKMKATDASYPDVRANNKPNSVAHQINFKLKPQKASLVQGCKPKGLPPSKSNHHRRHLAYATRVPSFRTLLFNRRTVTHIPLFAFELGERPL